MGNIEDCRVCKEDNQNYPPVSQPKKKQRNIELLDKKIPDQPEEQYAQRPKEKQRTIVKLSPQFQKIIENQTKLNPLKSNQKVRGKQLQLYKIKQSNAIYVGEWKEGRPQGKGKVYYQNGCFFDGWFHQGVAQCQDGLFIYSSGKAYYRGAIKQNRANGKGKMVYMITENKKLIYQGDWIMDTPDGKGTQTYPDGSHYSGDFKNGKKQGHGVYIWADQSTYEGQFKDGYMEGNGIQKLSNNQVYEGVFEKNKRIGRGKLKTSTGIYEGQFKNDKRQGQGRFTWNDGKYYIGQFKNGKLNGKGKLIFPNNQQIEGQWTDGVNTKVFRINQLTSQHQSIKVNLYNQNAELEETNKYKTTPYHQKNNEKEYQGEYNQRT